MVQLQFIIINAVQRNFQGTRLSICLSTPFSEHFCLFSLHRLTSLKRFIIYTQLNMFNG